MRTSIIGGTWGRWLTAGLACAVVGVAGLSVPACTKNVATGKNIFTLGMSRQQQIALGAQAAPQFTKEMGGRVEDARLQAYVDRIGRALAAHTEGDNRNWPWEFNYINTDQVNAFALPGGKVFFTRGLAEKLTSEAQMAGVIGHEIGHVVAEHGAQRMASHIAFNAGLIATAVVVGVSGNEDVQRAGAIGVPALAIGGNLVLLKFGRDEELEADRLGVRYMTRAGYDPRGQLEVMEVLKSLGGKGGRQPEFLSTHPDPDARIRQVQELLAGEYASTQNNPQYQQFRERYASEFLAVSKSLPAAPKPNTRAWLWMTPEQLASATGMDPAEFRYEDPTSWCAHCRLAAIEADHAEGGTPVACDGRSASARGMLSRAALQRR